MTTAERFKRWRTRAGLTQDQVAAAARSRGLQWTRSTVASMEIGRRELALSEFEQLRGTPVSFDELSPFFKAASHPKRMNEKSAVHLDAETKAAKRLGVEPVVVVKAARSLWGCTLTERRDAMAGASRGQRGHITRALIEALAAAVRAV